MRKLLLAGAAGCALATMAGPARAQITVTLSGDSQFIFGAVTNSRSDTTSGVKNNTFGEYIRTRLTTTAEGKADNGLEYGVKARLRLVTDGRVDFDESYTYIGTPALGRLMLGSKYSVWDDLKVVPPGYMSNGDAIGTGGVDGFWGAFAPNSAFNPWQINTDEPFTAGNFEPENQVEYFSPRLAGLQLGLAFIPSQNNSGTDVNRSTVVSAVNGPDGGGSYPTVFQNIYTAGVNFDTTKLSGVDLGGFSVQAAAAYQGGTAKNASIPLHDLSAYEAGLNIGFAGFTVGGFGMTTGKSGLQYGPATRDAWTWGGGAAYEFGKFGINYNYQRVVSDANASGTLLYGVTSTGSAAAPILGAVTGDIHTVGFGYSVAKGLQAGLEWDHYTTSGATSLGASSNPRADIFLLSTDMTF